MRGMRRTLCIVLAVPWMVAARDAAAQEAQLLTAALNGEQVDVSVNGVLFTSYTFSPGQKYPYFWPVMGPVSGKTVTTETSEPYPHHHSLFFGCDRVNGGNYWQEGNERGQILSQGPAIVEAAGTRVVITDECLWKQPGQAPVIRDTRTITLSAPNPATRLIDFEIVLHPLVYVKIEKTNHSLFSARMAPELSVASGGTLINAEGATAEKGTFGTASPWCDYFGTREGVTEGLAIFQHPLNPWYPAKWFTRDYGFFSPTPMFWPQGDFTALPAREPVMLAYRVVVHAGDVKAAGIAELFGAYRAAALVRDR